MCSFEDNSALFDEKERAKGPQSAFPQHSSPKSDRLLVYRSCASNCARTSISRGEANDGAGDDLGRCGNSGRRVERHKCACRGGILNTFDPKSVTELPTELALFPLPGATLLPATHLQLNIFEPRYLNMVFDALSNSRMLGMVQPRQSLTGNEVVAEGDNSEPDLHRVGCAGRIVSFGETGDGRLLITLRGICRYSLGAELAMQRGYRRASVDWS